MKKSLALLLTAVLLLCFVPACGKEAELSGYIVKYDLTAAPRSLDPQLATSSESLLVVENTFEGLLRQDENGELLPGVAKSYEISEDGLTYTFHLREDAKWSDESKTPVTARDFVFAFRRVVDPGTGSPGAANFLCIRNAKEILAGEYGVSSLGVEARDDFTLLVRLETPNPFFPEVMASAAAMPCNEAFFEEQRGRYGLGPQYLIFNGPYRIDLGSYDPDALIRLRPNLNYRSATPLVANGANLSIQSDDQYSKKDPDAVLKTADEKVLERFSQGKTDAAPISYADVERMRDRDGVDVFSFENIVWGLAFNCNTNTYGTESIRRAFALSMDPTAFEPYLNGNLTPARAIVPSAIKLLDHPYRELGGTDLLPARDPALARELFNEGLSSLEVGKLSRTSILCPEGDAFPVLLGLFQGQLQDTLGAFVNVEPLPADELRARVASGDYMVALIPLTAGRNNPDSVLGVFSNLSTQNVTGYENPELDDILTRAMTANGIYQAAALYRQAERLLIDSAVYLPIAYETSYYASSPEIHDLRFSPFSYRVFFKYAYRQKDP